MLDRHLRHISTTCTEMWRVSGQMGEQGRGGIRRSSDGRKSAFTYCTMKREVSEKVEEPWRQKYFVTSDSTGSEMNPVYLSLQIELLSVS